MNSRMDRYETTNSKTLSRSARNQQLYESVKTSTLSNYDINSNISVIAEDASKVSVSRVKKILDDKYNSNTPKRVSIEIPEFKDDEEERKVDVDTKEYDINAILEKAKQGKNIDYSKERLKKVRDTQYEILNSLDLSLKKIEEKPKTPKYEEENLMNLINTITELELKNKEETRHQKEIEDALGLLSDLSDEIPAVSHEFTGTVTEVKEEKPEPKKEEVKKDNLDKKLEKTLKDLDLKVNDYDDFKDISKGDKSAIILKIILFVVIIGLVVAGLLILNNMLNLNLF